MTRFFVMCGAVTLAGCGAGEPYLSMTVDKRTFDPSTERVLIELRADAAEGTAGRGTVTLVAASGSFIEGDVIPLIDGLGHATYRCDPKDDSACNGDLRLGASWSGVNASTVVKAGVTVQSQVRWKIIPTGVAVDLTAAAPAVDGSTWAVGSNGTVLRFFNGAWQSLPTGRQTDFTGVWAGAQATYVVGRDGIALRWNGQRFDLIASLKKEDFTAVWGADDAHVYIASETGSLFLWDGASLAKVADGTIPLTAVGGRAGQVWAAGENVVLQDKGDGAGFVASTPALIGRWTSVLARPEGVWLAGERLDGAPQKGVVVTGPTPDWRATQVSADPVVALFWPETSTERFAITATEVYRRVGEETWVATKAPIGGRAIAAHSATDVIVVGDKGIAIQRVP